MMYKKFLSCVFLCGLWNVEPVFGMMKEGAEEQDIEQSPLVEINKIAWPIVAKKSYIFKTEDPNIQLILLYSSKKNMYYLYDYVENNIKKDKRPTFIISFPNENFPIIECYVPFAHKTNSGYEFYITTKEKSGISQEKYAVKKIYIHANPDNEPIISPLYEHNSPIMHLGMVKNENKEYLVSGSSYPSIKMRDLKRIFNPKTKKEAVTPLHNRFLLGCTENTLIYARKKYRRQTGPTRLLYSKIYKEFDSTICTLTDSFNKDSEIDTKIDIKINQNNYPITATNGTDIYIFDPQENKQLYPKISASLIPSTILIRGKKEPEPTISTIQKFLSDPHVWECFKAQVTFASFLQFAQQNPTKNVGAYIYTMIQNIINVYIDQWAGKEQLIDSMTTFIKAQLESFNKKKQTIEQMLFTQDTYDNLQKIMSNNLFELYAKPAFVYMQHVKKVSTDIIAQDDTFYTYTLKKNNIKHVIVDGEYITMHTDYQIWQGKIEDNTIINLTKLTQTEEEIQNLFTIDSKVFYITGNALYKINLNPHKINPQLSFSKQTPYSNLDININMIQKIIADLISESSSAKLKALFEVNDKFFLEGIEKIPYDRQYSLSSTTEDAVTRIVRHNYLEKILFEWVSTTTKKYFIEDNEKQESPNNFLVQKLSSLFLDNDTIAKNKTTFLGLQLYINNTILSDLKLKIRTLKGFKEKVSIYFSHTNRFFDMTKLENFAQNESKILQLLYRLEQNGYLNEIRIKMIQKIADLSNNPEEIHHIIMRVENK